MQQQQINTMCAELIQFNNGEEAGKLRYGRGETGSHSEKDVVCAFAAPSK